MWATSCRLSAERLPAASFPCCQATLKLILQGDAKKGDVLGIARIAAIQASKKTSDLIPLCHPIALTKVSITFDIDEKTTCDYLHRYHRNHRPNWCRDGSADRREYWLADDLRYVQSG